MRAKASIGAAMAAAAIGVAAMTIQTGVAAQEGNPSEADPGMNQDQTNQNPANQNNPDKNQANPDKTTSARTVTTTATIQRIDKEAGTVSLKGANGTTVDVKPGPDVKLDQLKVGDRVNATYYEELAVAISKPGQAQHKATQATVQRGGVTARQATMTAQILSVNQKNNTVLIRGPQGMTHVVTVQDPALQAKLGRIKPGDNVDITYTQAVATSLEPMK